MGVGTTGEGRIVSVVMVDDQTMFIQSLAKLLSEEPQLSVVALAGTAAGGIEAVRRHAPSVVLMDNELPDGRGTEAAARILLERPATKVVMLTATDDEDVLLAAIEAGCAGYVTKLSPVEDVVAAIWAADAGEVVMPMEVLARLLPRVRRQGDATGSRLSDRELEVLKLVAAGLTNSQIGKRLYISTNTVRNHVQNTLTKLGAHSKLEALSIAVREGLVRYP